MQRHNQRARWLVDALEHVTDVSEMAVVWDEDKVRRMTENKHVYAEHSFISYATRPRSTQPGHPFVGSRRRNEYQPKGDDALRLGNKGRYGSCVGGR